jgi:hypothetical protein
LSIKFDKHVKSERTSRAIFSHNGVEDLLQLDFPDPFARAERFTVFWRGAATHSALCEFISDLWNPSRDLVASLFFFQNAEVQIPPRYVSNIPPPAEKDILSDFGVGPQRTPLFARYELYSQNAAILNTASRDLRLSRFVGWVALPMPTELTPSEIGIFTSLAELDAEKVRERVAGFFESTISDLSFDEASKGLNLILDFMEARY